MEKKEEKILNLLSIDFDYIMWPIIKTYNDLCSESENPTIIFDRIKEERGLREEDLNYDSKTLMNIVQLLKLYRNTSNQFYAIDDHEKIISEVLSKYNDDTKWNVVNIDFHHDFIYRDSDVEDITAYNKYNCSNWVGYMAYGLKNLYTYTWVAAPNSGPDFNIMPDNDDFGKHKFIRHHSINEFINIYDEKPIQFDDIVLCFSPQWVPHKYRHLFDILSYIFGGE